jgi:hypothetical protein
MLLLANELLLPLLLDNVVLVVFRFIYPRKKNFIAADPAYSVYHGLKLNGTFG